MEMEGLSSFRSISFTEASFVCIVLGVVAVQFLTPANPVASSLRFAQQLCSQVSKI